MIYPMEDLQNYWVIGALKDMHKPETKKEDPGTNIVDFIELFAKETTAQKARTVKTYRGLRSHLSRYEKTKKRRLTFENIDVPTIKSIQNFLLQEFVVLTKKKNKKAVQLNNISVAKLLSILKTLLRKAEANTTLL